MSIFDGLKQFFFGDDDDDKEEVVANSEDDEDTEGEPYNYEVEPDIVDGENPDQGEPGYVQMQETNREDPSEKKSIWERFFGLN